MVAKRTPNIMSPPQISSPKASSSKVTSNKTSTSRMGTGMEDCDCVDVCEQGMYDDFCEPTYPVTHPTSLTTVGPPSPGVSLHTIAKALEHVQATMCTMDRKMGHTGKVVRRVVKRLREQGLKVQCLQKRLKSVEPRVNVCCEPLRPCMQPLQKICKKPWMNPCQKACPEVPPCPRPCLIPRPAHCSPGVDKCPLRACRSCAARHCLSQHAGQTCCCPQDSCSCSKVCCPKRRKSCLLVRPRCTNGGCCPPYMIRSHPSAVKPCPVPLKDTGPCTCSASPCVCPSKCTTTCEDPPASCDDHLVSEFLAPLGRQLFAMAHEGRMDEVLNLLMAGADVNFCNSSKWTALHKAAAQAHPCVVGLLLQWGAYVNVATIYGFTPLHLAAANDCTARCVTLLIEGGADLNSWNRSGQVPLHLAAENDNVEAVRALVTAGASKCAQDEDGRMPFDVAKGACVRKLVRPCCRFRRNCCRRTRSACPACPNCAARCVPVVRFIC